MSSFDYNGLSIKIGSKGTQQGILEYFTEDGFETLSERILELEESLSDGDVQSLEQLMKMVIYKYLELSSEQENIEEYFQPIIDTRNQVSSENIVDNLKPMLIGNHTYGNYNPELKSFWCTYGAWEGEVKFIDDKTLQLFSGKMAEVVDYQFIDKIPEDYNYT